MAVAGCCGHGISANVNPGIRMPGFGDGFPFAVLKVLWPCLSSATEAIWADGKSARARNTAWRQFS